VSAFVQGKDGGVINARNVAGNPGAPSYNSNNTAGNLLIAFVWWSGPDAGSTFNLTSVTDSQGNTWNLIAGTLKGRASTNFTNIYCQIAYAANCKAGANTVSANLSGSPSNLDYCWISIAEFSGANIVDQTSTGSGTGATITTGSVTPVQNNEVVVGVMVGDLSVSPGPGSGFTSIALSSAAGGGWISEYLIQTTATSVAATFTDSGTITDWSCALATFGTSPLSSGIAGLFGYIGA
jgi:hypothetical protein